MWAYSTPVDEMSLLNQGSCDLEREALRWSETHSSSYLSNALEAVGIKKKEKKHISSVASEET